MRIGINATCLNDRPSGAKQRFLGLYSALFCERPDDEFTVFSPIDCDMSAWFLDCPNVSIVQTRIPSVGRVKKFLSSKFYLPRAFDLGRFECFEVLQLPIVRPRHAHSILTIHDVRGVRSEKPWLYRTMYHRVVKDGLSRADHVVTVSECMREEILAIYDRTPVSVVYNGINSFRRPKKEISRYSQADRYKLPREFLLSVGHLESRKNYCQLVKAVALLKDRGVDIPLVIIGQDSGEGDALRRHIDMLDLSDRVTILSGVSDDDLLDFYEAAILFVFPSVYEGFGVPILEAMAAGTPMVLSDLKVFRELSHGKPRFFCPYDLEDMADAIEMGLVDSQYRRDTVDFGYERVQAFSFDKLAKQLSSIYGRGMPS
jgi:glycosyltransferase involved in cell wall biosynthesis